MSVRDKIRTMIIVCILKSISMYILKFVVVEVISPKQCNEVHNKIVN